MGKASSTNPNGTILAVDDTPENLDLLNRILSRKGFQVTTSTSGAQALDLVKEFSPELILLDIRMPDVDGYTVCQVLKCDPATRNIPIIFISGLDEVLNKVKAFEVGGVDFIVKPFEAAEVVVRVNNHLTLRRLHQQLEIQNERLRQEIHDRQTIEAALQAANQELQRLVHLDGLTQVANRRSFDADLLQEWRRMQREQCPLALIFCDVDYFKAYNDTYGHQAGDDCLRKIATAIATVVKRSGDLVARYGGEEFAVILPNTPLSGALYVAIEIKLAIQALRIPHAASFAARYVTLSLGVATVTPQPEFSPELLITVADRALYRAKLEGRNRIYVEDFQRWVDNQALPNAET